MAHGPERSAPSPASARWALLYGNFVIGCGVMVVPGSLNDLTRSLDVSVAVGGQLITAAAITMCVGAPLLAAAVGAIDRRRLLMLAMLWYALGHALSALVPSYAALLPLRAGTMLAAAIFTPQAAAVVGSLASPAERGRAITFIFLGWSVASVFGLPLHSYIGEAFGWRWAFALVAVLAAIGAVAVQAVLPAGIRPAPMDGRAWRQILTDPVLMAIVAVTAIAGSGQFTVFVYFAPFFKQVFGADATQISLMFAAFGLCGFIGNVLLSRSVDRVGAGRAVAVLLMMVATTMLLWPLAGSLATLALVMLPWALSFFACNSAQQARLGQAAPQMAPALMALNTSAIYFGQAIGAAGGGAMVNAQIASGATGAGVFRQLHWVALAWTLAALALSLWAGWRCRQRGLSAPAASSA